MTSPDSADRSDLPALAAPRLPGAAAALALGAGALVTFTLVLGLLLPVLGVASFLLAHGVWLGGGLFFLLWAAGYAVRPSLALHAPGRLAVGGGILLGAGAFPWVAASYALLVRFHPPAPEHFADAERMTRLVMEGSPVLAVLAASLGPPLGEEWFFRGLLFGGIGRRFGHVAAVVSTALLFGVVHSGWADVHRIAPMVALGVVLGAVRAVTRSVWPCVAMHAVYNALVVCTALGAGEADAAGDVPLPSPALLAVAALACAGGAAAVVRGARRL